MALDRQNLVALGKIVAKADSSTPSTYSYNGQNLTYDACNETFRKEMNELASNFREYRRNRNLIFELIEVGVDEILPARVMQNYGQFAEVKTYAQGDKPIFSTRISAKSRIRAKNNFVTRVGLAGRYEVFKLDGATYEIPTSAWGGAAQIGFEEFLDGRIQMSDVYDLILEGMDEAVYREIAKGLDAAVAKVGLKNKTTQTGFVEAQMDKLIQTADVYGKSTIYCTFEFAATMIPDDRWASNEMKQERWDVGYYASYKGHNVIILPQSFTDIDNAVKVMDPSKAYIIPTGSDKPVKVAFEGETAVREVESQEDWSREIQTYRKFGVGVILVNPGICVYTNSQLHINN